MNPGQLRPPAVPLAASWILYGIVLIVLPTGLPRVVAVVTFLAVAATQVVFVAGLPGPVCRLAPVLVTAGVAVVGAARPCVLGMRCDPYALLLIGLGVFHAAASLAIRPRCGRWPVCVLGVYEVLVGVSAMLAVENPLRYLLGAYAVGFGLTQLAYAYTLQELSRMTFQRRARAAR
ncbi:hypothetical protein TH66_21245 [Carbonactinospora thermoautotrophica]|uniref:Uncharacterized protein n=1 Tax=Carbonactinospora thermoautotrophica TaxID=1469144 RepID=A0A132MJ65_9ACTN|nr:hypothetical protein [Carbonactinospora thermoautotrophica]KWW97910.1 hypothetical protein TH66_21245 [Carbonactinospora thermoautotrophica]KWX07020.1 hypothetical protein TR74_20165 [Carbonactinospora thermoautotrophica]